MPRVKVKRKSTFIDMTAMSDVTVLLLTFFMLTSTFVQKEPVQVETPDSVSEIQIETENVLQILIDEEGKIYMSIDNLDDREQLIKDVAEQRGISLTNKEIESFRILPSFGTPFKDLKKFLALQPHDQDKALKGEVPGIRVGIPCDNADGVESVNNELKVWVKAARAVKGKKMKIAIKAASETPYPTIRNLMTSLQDIRENRYNLITNLKTISDDKKVVVK